MNSLIKNLALILCFGICNSTFGEPIVSWDYSRETTGTAIRSSSIGMNLSYHLTADTYSPIGVSVFNSFQFDESNIGETITVDAENNPSFEAFSSYLTDGLDYAIAHNTLLDTGTGVTELTQEGFLLGGSPKSLNNIDLQGYRIDSISYTITSLSLNDTNRFSRYVSSLGGTFSINGSTIPEPNSAILIFLALMIIRMKRISNQ